MAVHAHNWIFNREHPRDPKLVIYRCSASNCKREHILHCDEVATFLALEDQKPFVSEEVRTTSSTGGQKGVKLERFDLIPVGPLRELAKLYGKGAMKYDDRNWEKGYEWNKSYAALQRHANAFWGGEEYDNHKPDCAPDCVEHTECHHMAAVAWHAFVLVEFTNTHPEFDTRPGL